MKSFEELKRNLPFVRTLIPGTYASQIEIGGKKGSVVFGFNEDGWEHVSFAPYNQKTPTWDMMCELKDMFWNPDEDAIEIHPKKSEYVNMKENCLHLWAKIGGMELPDRHGVV